MSSGALQLFQGLGVCALHERENCRKLGSEAFEPPRVGDNADHHLHLVTCTLSPASRLSSTGAICCGAGLIASSAGASEKQDARKEK
jgi:hypothetical protein